MPIKDKARKVAQVRAWQAKNPDRVKKAQSKWVRDNPQYRMSVRLKKYGLTIESFERLLESQDHKCAICKTADPGKKGWQVDHCHLTGKVRGVLCLHCNLALGHLKDKAELLRAAVAYLEAESSRHE